MATQTREALEVFLPRLVEARHKGVDEAETVDRVAQLFGEVLGYRAEELTRDKAVKHTFVDLAVQLGDEIPLLIEVVAAETPLRIGHLEEARKAAARDNVPFILLTNGLAWNLYHVDLDESLTIAVVFAVDIASGVSEEAAEMLGLLERGRLGEGALREYWTQRCSLDPATLGRMLFEPQVLGLIRDLLRDNASIRVDSRLLAAAIHELLTPDAQRQIGPV